MENIDPAPDSSSAHEALADIDRAQRAIRDTPWPLWLYPANALLFGVMGVTTLLSDYRVTAWLAVAFLIVGLNVVVGLRIGVPMALPTSRAFLVSVVVAAAFLFAALAVSDQSGGGPGLVVALSFGATVSYLIGSIAHIRSTRR